MAGSTTAATAPHKLGDTAGERTDYLVGECARVASCAHRMPPAEPVVEPTVSAGTYGAETVARAHLVYAAYCGSDRGSDVGTDCGSAERYILLLVNIDDVDVPGTDATARREETYSRVKASGADAGRGHTVGRLIISLSARRTESDG